MANHSVNDQVTFVVQWFNTWSEYQKDDFIHILAPKVSPGQYVNGIVNGLKTLDASGRPPSLFACQTKLFNDWWGSWSEGDQEKFMNTIKGLDDKFWSEVEAEVNGTRKKLDEDFFTVTITATPVTGTRKVICDSATVELAEEAKEIDGEDGKGNPVMEVAESQSTENGQLTEALAELA